MILLQTSNLHKSYLVDPVLSGVDFEVQTNQRIGLIGRNGSGKSTLLKILAGELTFESGQLHRAKELSIGYLEQTPQTQNTHTTVYEYCLEAYRDLLDLQHELLELTAEIAKDPHNMTLQSRYAERQQDFDDANGYAVESRVRGILIGLGFVPEDQAKPIDLLSGGERTRLELAYLLSRDYDVLLLDEPTNHLDIKAITWLEDYLQNYNGAVVIITHDRVFLDRTINRIYELENGKGSWFDGNYSSYVEQKRLRYEQQVHDYAGYIQKRKAEEDKLRVFRERSHKNSKFAARARDREKKLARMEVVDKPLWLDRSMKLSFKPTRTTGHDVLKVRDLAKSFSERELFSNLSFDVFSGDILGIAGPNGIGKTTLLKILTDQLTADRGEFFYGARVDWGYYEQANTHLNPANDLITEINQTYPELDVRQIRNMLAAFLFTGDDVFKTIGSLSGGEKARLALLKLMLEGKNLLILDEPTNHLDLPSKETLEAALKVFPGTLIFVSHDRYFLNQLSTKTLWMDEGNYRIIQGNFNDLSRPNAQELKPTPIVKSKSEAKKSEPEQVEQTQSDTELLKQLLEAEKELESDLEISWPAFYNGTDNNH